MSGNLGVLNILLGLNIANFQSALQKSNYQIKTFAKQAQDEMKEVGVSVEQVKGHFDGLQKVLQNPHLMYSGLFSVKSIIDAADSFGQYSSRLKQATSDTVEFKQIQAQLLETSNRTFKNYEDATELFIRTSGALKQLGYDAQTAADLVSTVQFGLTVDSADTQKAQSVINAISSTILSGKMDMEKFNTIVAASPSLFQALADSIAGGSQEALRKMVLEGKVTANQLIQITKEMENLGKRADIMPTTVADAFVKLKNNFTQYVGETNESLEATHKLSAGISLLADNLDVVVAAGMGFTGMKFAEKTVEYTVAVQKLVKEQQKDLEIQAKKALKNRELAASNVQLALAELNAAQGTVLAEKASDALNLARIKEAEATQKAKNAQKEYAASMTLTGRALNFIGGPMGLLNLAVTAGAAAWAYFSREGENANRVTDRLTEGVDALRSSLDGLNAAQARQAAKQVEEAIARQSDELMKYTTQIEYLKIQLETYPKNSMLEQWNKDLIDAEGNAASAQKELDALKSRLNDLNNIASKSKKISEYLIPKGMEKWDEYLKNLENTRDVIGLNARELGEFQARQKGANEEQQKMAGIIAAQSDEYKNLQDAISRKDVAAEAAALENIKNLDIENQRLSILAQKTIEVARLLEMVSSGVISSEMATQLKGIIENTYNLAAQSITEQSDESKAKVAQIKLNTAPTSRASNRRGGGRSGGGGSKESELQSLTKSLKEQVAVLGMTDLEAQKYKISLMQGSEAAKAYAVSLAETISRHKEEQETLKQNRMLLEEITVFRDKTMLPLDMMGWGDKAREQMNQVVGIREEYAQKRRQLEENQESESSRISDEAYQARLLALEEAESKKLAILEESFQRQKLLESNWALGATEALNNYAAETANIYASVGNLVGNAFQGMEDALLDFVMTGKLSFKDFANSIIKDMMRIFIQQQITGLFAQGLSGLFGGGVQTLGAPTTSWSFGTFPVAKANGGLITGPGTGTSDSIPAMLSNGEFVINARATRQNLRLLEAINAGRQPVYRANGGIVGNVPAVPSLQSYREGGNQITVNISNHGSQPVAGNAKMTTDDVGNRVIDIMLFDLNSNGRYAQQLKQMRR